MVFESQLKKLKRGRSKVLSKGRMKGRWKDYLVETLEVHPDQVEVLLDRVEVHPELDIIVQPVSVQDQSEQVKLNSIVGIAVQCFPTMKLIFSIARKGSEIKECVARKIGNVS